MSEIALPDTSSADALTDSMDNPSPKTADPVAKPAAKAAPKASPTPTSGNVTSALSAMTPKAKASDASSEDDGDIRTSKHDVRNTGYHTAFEARHGGGIGEISPLSS